MFLNSTDKHVCSANGDLNHLESMVFGTVSFEELLGHCNEVLKINQKYISNIEDQISHFGYVPGKWASISIVVLFIGFYWNSVITPLFAVTVETDFVWTGNGIQLVTINKKIPKENDQRFVIPAHIW